MKTKIKHFLQLFLPLIAGSLIGLIIKNTMDYTSLIQPPLAPPAILFPIAWTILYLLLGIAYFLYRKNLANPKSIFLYYLQLIFNLLWPIIFFTLKLRLFSIFWIILLLGFVLFLIKSWKEETKLSAYLLIPYFIWLIFATYLNIGIYILN